MTLDLDRTTTVAGLTASHLGRVIAFNGWRGRLVSMYAERPGWVELVLAPLDPADSGTVTVVPLEQPVRIEAL